MDIETAKFAFQILQFLLTGGIGIYVWLSNKDKVTNDRVGKIAESVDGKIDAHAERIARLEQGAESCETAQRTCPVHAERLAQLEAAADRSPTHEDLGRLHEKINDVSGALQTLVGEFKGVHRTLDLIHEHLLKGGR